MEDEMGDIFFATVNLARWYKIDAEQALLRANKKFTKQLEKASKTADYALILGEDEIKANKVYLFITILISLDCIIRFIAFNQI